MAQMVMNLPAMQESWVQSLSWEDSPGERNGYTLQYSCLENSSILVNKREAKECRIHICIYLHMFMYTHSLITYSCIIYNDKFDKCSERKVIET